MARPFIVVPAYNEEKVIGQTVAALSPLGDVLVVSDGTDRTARIARNEGADVLEIAQRVGKGEAIRRGLALSTSRISAYIDADLPVAPEEFGKMLKMAEKWDVVIASRWKGHASGYPLFRSLGSRIYNLSARLAGSRFTDLQCGAKAMGRRGRDVALSTLSPGYFFDTEFVLSAVRKGLSVAEVGVEWRHGRRRPKPGVGDARLLMAELILFAFGKGKFRRL